MKLRLPRSRSVVFLLILICSTIARAEPGGATQQAEAQPGVFYLLTRHLTPDPMSHSVLTCELYRQGVLMAAREGLGLQTRDESLREWRGEAPGAARWTFIPSDVNFGIADGTGADIWKQKMPDHSPWQKQIVEQTVVVEKLAREDFVKLLRDHGFNGTGNVKNPAAAPPADAEARLREFEELSQFAVLRETHSVIRNDGESEARLGVLVRAYANLGQLTRFHWSIEHQVFTARSLLYAQRMVNNDPRSATALWHHAYAMAMAGFQGQSLKDLKAANELAEGLKAPAWVELLEPFCQYNYRRLNELASADVSRAPLSQYFAFLAIEKSGCQAVTLKIERAALVANPRCLRLVDAMCSETGPGPLNQLVEDGPQIFGNTLGSELEKMPGLPAAVVNKIHAVQKTGERLRNRDAVCQTLIDESTPDKDKLEPSWAVLGRTIQETTFAHVRRKADLIALQWGVDASDYVAEVQPAISEHRFKGVVDAYAGYLEQPWTKSIAAMKTIQLDDLTLTELPFYHLENVFASRGPGSRTKFIGIFKRDMDTTSFDLETWLGLYAGTLRGDDLADLTDRLQSVSPHSPWITCNEIVGHWSIDKVPAWELANGEYPSVALALGKQFVRIGDWEDAERWLTQYVHLSPDAAGYRTLASVYRSQGKEDLWLKTYKEFLAKTAPEGLEHAQIESEIAYHFMEQGKYKEAIPFADSAAATGAAWGLQCATDAHTGAGDYQVAERLVIERYMHYSESPYLWLTWCVQTGHGNQPAAIKAFHDYIAARGRAASDEDLLQWAVVNVLEGKQADAIVRLNRRFKNAPGPFSLIYVIILADEIDDAASRDAALKQVPTVRVGNGLFRSFAAELVKAYQPGASLDLKAVDRLIQHSDGVDRIDLAFLTARYLLKHDQKDAAVGYLKQCYFGFREYSVNNLVLYKTSRDVGLDPLSLSAPSTRPAK